MRPISAHSYSALSYSRKPFPLGKAATASHHFENQVVGKSAAKLVANVVRICASVKGSLPAAALVAFTVEIAIEIA